MKVYVSLGNDEPLEFEAEKAEERDGSLIVIAKVGNQYEPDQIAARFSLRDISSWWRVV